jgi:eukaryotic-like serine/threonine-protein kinase
MRLRLKLPSVAEAVDSEAVNISKSGMFIAMEELPPIGCAIDVEIEGAGDVLLLHANVEVVRHQESPTRGIGVRFIDIAYEASALIERMLADQKLFGDYRLEVLLGRGGMAEVYRARELQGPTAGRVVALKRMLPELTANRLVVELFERESAITSALKHPHIIETYQVGSEGSALYIAMELIEGCDLREILEECVTRDIFLPIDFACYVSKTVAHALDFVHRAKDPDGRPFGVVHRDVSPSNVFISHRGEIKLGDFGVAHIGGHRPGDAGRAIAGKDPYLAPEQITAAQASPATDVFALTAILYELLTNQLAFHGRSRDEVWEKIIDGKVTPPRKLRPEISRELEEVVMTGLSPRVAGGDMSFGARLRELRSGKRERYPDAASFAAALDPVFDHGIGNELAISSVVRNLFKDRLRTN